MQLTYFSHCKHWMEARGDTCMSWPVRIVAQQNKVGEIHTSIKPCKRGDVGKRRVWGEKWRMRKKSGKRVRFRERMVAVKNPCQAAEGDMTPSNKFLWLWREICVEHAVIATVNERTWLLWWTRVKLAPRKCNVKSTFFFCCCCELRDYLCDVLNFLWLKFITRKVALIPRPFRCDFRLSSVWQLVENSSQIWLN